MCDVSDPVKSEAQKTPAEPPTKRPTQADVARLAGVSTATVSHVLSGRADRRGPGSSETRAAVEAAMKQLDYRPNWAGRALRRQRTGLVGALVSEPSNPWREGLIATAQRELARHCLDLVVFPGVPDTQTSARFFELVDQRAVDACFTIHVEERHLSRELARCPIPVLAFAEGGFDGVAKARHEYAAAAAEAVDVLTGRGVRRFVILAEVASEAAALGRDFVDPVLERVENSSDGPSAVQLLEVDYRISADLSGIDWDTLGDAPSTDPVVLMCSSDRLAIQVWAECRRRGIDVGRSVGVVGRGDIAEASRPPVSLSTLGTSGAEYGDVFASLAAAAHSGEQISRGWSFPWHFLERYSTAGLRAG